MARKSETPATKILNLLIGLAVLTVVVAALLLPLYLIYQTVAESLPIRRIRRTLRGDATDFWLDEEENKSFKEGSVRMDELRRKIRLEEERAHENGIGRNNNGSFTRRSYLGKEIQENIESYESQREELSSAIRSLKFQPFHRWEEFNSLVKNQLKVSTALKAWFAVMICGFFATGRTRPWDLFRPYINFISFPFVDDPNSIRFEFVMLDIMSIFLATAAAAIAWMISRNYMKKPAARYTPEPEIVSLENVDSPGVAIHSSKRYRIALPVFWTVANVTAVVLGLIITSMITFSKEDKKRRILLAEAADDAKGAAEAMRVQSPPKVPMGSITSEREAVAMNTEQRAPEPLPEMTHIAQPPLVARPEPLKAGMFEEQSHSRQKQSGTLVLRAMPLAAIPLEQDEEGLEVDPSNPRLLPEVVETWDFAKSRLEINRIYARYGVEFPDKAIQAWAGRQPWYHRVPGRTFEQAEGLFSPADKYNIELIADRRNRLRPK